MNRSALSLSLFFVAACGGGGDGDLAVGADVDSVVSGGLEPGEGPEDIADGWSLTFERYGVHFGDVEIGRLAEPERARVLEVNRVVDLARVSGRVELGGLTGLAAGRWDAVSYEVRSASEASGCDPSAGDPGDDESVCAAMRGGGHAVLAEGTIENPAGRSCPPDDSPGDPEDSCVAATSVRFAFAFPLEARFVECRTASGPGVGIPSGGEASISLSFHTEHLLFNAFGEGARTVVLRAQFLANADLDGDGTVTLDELESIDASDFDQLFTNGSDIESFSSEYSLSGALLPIETAADYVRAHLMTQGHLDGEQECEPEAL